MERECKESVQLTFTELCEPLNLDETQSRRQILECAAMEVARGMADPGRDETRYGMEITKIMQNPSYWKERNIAGVLSIQNAGFMTFEHFS